MHWSYQNSQLLSWELHLTFFVAPDGKFQSTIAKFQVMLTQIDKIGIFDTFLRKKITSQTRRVYSLVSTPTPKI